MEVENTGDSPDNTGDSAAKDESSEFEARMKTLLDTQEAKFNTMLNGVIAKLKKESKTPSTVDSPPPLGKDKTQDIDNSGITLETLKSEWELKNKALQEEIKSEREARVKDKELIFLSEVKAESIRKLSDLGFDDVSETYSVFLSKHPGKFIKGDSGYVLYQSDEDSELVTLDKLFDDWKKTKTGKRFLKAVLPKGDGLTDSNPPKSSPGKSSKKLKTLSEITKAVSEGDMKFTTDYS